MRRGKGEGSIFQRDNGTWCSRIDIGRDANGKRIRRDIYGKTKKEVTDKLARLQINKMDGTIVACSSLTVAGYLETWLNDSAALTVRKTTLRWYRDNVNNHIVPAIGHIVLQKLTPSQVQKMIADMAREGASARKREIIYSIIHRALKIAVKRELVVRNVATAVERPKVPKHEITPLSDDQAIRFIRHAEQDRLYAMYVLAITTGCRQGELFAVKWSDIDLDAGTMAIRRTLVLLDNEFSIHEPKTKAGRRMVTLPAIAVEALWKHKAAMLAEGLAGNEFVFVDTDGNHLRRNNVARRSFAPLLKAAECPEIRFHDLRHSCATLLLTQKIHPKVVQERLGHSQISMTMDLYSHCVPSLQAEAADKMDSILQIKAG